MKPAKGEKASSQSKGSEKPIKKKSARKKVSKKNAARKKASKIKSTQPKTRKRSRTDTSPADPVESNPVPKSGAEAGTPAVVEAAEVVIKTEPRRSMGPGSRLRHLEDRLENLLSSDSQSPKDEAPASIRAQVSDTARDVVSRLAPPSPGYASRASDMMRELYRSDYYMRQWGGLQARDRSDEIDDLGMDSGYAQKTLAISEFFYKHYFRVATDGVENIPNHGPCVIVSNHSGTLPLDGLMLRAALHREHPRRRDLRWLIEDELVKMPFLGTFMNRMGAVRACPENATHLLAQNQLVAVFPEGNKGSSKLFRQRYRLQRFGRGGFVRLCLKNRTPLVPCAIVGAEESNPLLYRHQGLGRLLGLPYLPITPTFPWLGPVGLIPAPSKWKILFAERIDFDDYGPDAAEDDVLVARLAEEVRGSIQRLLDTHVRDRKSVWFG